MKNKKGDENDEINKRVLRRLSQCFDGVRVHISRSQASLNLLTCINKWFRMEFGIIYFLECSQLGNMDIETINYHHWQEGKSS